MKRSRGPPSGGPPPRVREVRSESSIFFSIYTPPQAAESEATEMTEKAVLFVRSDARAAGGKDSLRKQEKAGRRFARRSGLRIARTWTVRARTPLEDRRAFRSFVAGVKRDPSIKVILFERPQGISRRARDLVTLHDLARETGKEFRFFGSDHPAQARLDFEIRVCFMRHFLACLRESRGRSERGHPHR